ncbi:hypothetical protein UFOVP380_18 [uncultured Caudovirales phage]|uniref:Tail protein n=1 Tax=uncultured Caudovirales phage TaxID=2100421 RepID=A0A6J7WZH8_9CAUD|nr:hypothetical protein UFOVP380_18 [uncultured Caudovirales phage]
MTRQFNRLVGLRISGVKDTLTLNEGLDIQFHIRKDRSSMPNEATVSIKNLSEASRKFMAVDADFELSVGYDGQAQLLAKMDIARCTTTWSPPDSVTELQGLDGYAAMKNKNVTLGLAAGATVNQAIASIAKQLGLPMRVMGEQTVRIPLPPSKKKAAPKRHRAKSRKRKIKRKVWLKHPLKGGYSHTGKASQALDDLASKVGATWGIVNGILLFVLKGEAINTVPVLTISPENGLLAQPEVLDDTVSSDRVLPKYIKPKGYQVTMLLRPNLNPFDLIEVKSRFVNGLFVVDTVEHRGGNRVDEFITRATIHER